MANTQQQFQRQIEQSVGGLANSDDEGDITNESLGGDSSYEDYETGDPDEDGGEDVPGSDESTDGASDEPSYKKSQVESIVKTRVGTLNRRIDKLQNFKKAVDKMCEITGLDFEKLANRLETMTVEEQAKILGMTPQQIRDAQQSRAEVAKERGVNQTLARQLEEQKLMADPKFSDFDLYKDEIDELIEENPKLTLKQAYLLAKGDTAVTSAARDAEQRALAKQVNSQKKGVVKPVGSSGKSGTKLSAEVVSAAKAVGMDPVEYAKYQSIDNLDSYRASKKK